MDMILQILANGGDKAVLWATTAAIAWVGLRVSGLLRNQYVRGVVERAFAEVKDAVLLVEQTYLSALRKANEDGKITEEEKKQALALAVAEAKKLIGMAGLKRLARVLGLGDVDAWLSSKVEVAVATGKLAGVLPAVASKPASVQLPPP
jgi:hypothetical protein